MISRLITWLEDQVLTFLQRRCSHPGYMVAADILEGSAPVVAIQYCRRCGSFKALWATHPYSEWRHPWPNLWR